MAELMQNQVPKGIRNLFTKGYSALEAGNYDYSIELLLKCVELSPMFLRARKTLRAAAIARFKKKGGGIFAKLAYITGIFGFFKVRSLIKKDPLKAVIAAENLLKDNPLHVPFVILFADAAVAADMVEAATMTLEITREEFPGNVELVKHLAHVYQEVGNNAAARECFEKLLDVRPNDGLVLKLLKDAMARASMDEGRWESVAQEGGSFQEMLANKDQAQNLERQGKSVKSSEDIDSLISELVEKMESEPENLNYRRELSRLYRQQKMYDEALATLDVAKSISAVDPEIDRMIAETNTMRFNDRIAAMREKGNEEGAVALENERNQYVFDNLQERVERYPNDPHLRYELGRQYFMYDYIDQSIQQFQIAQRSPKDRVMALFYLGRAFLSKGQNDMALVQLEEAATCTPRMDNTKKDILYVLGEVCEKMGDFDKALEHYKKIYSVDISYKDISSKVEKAYAAKASEKSE